MNKWEQRVGMIGPLGQRVAQIDELSVVNETRDGDTIIITFSDGAKLTMSQADQSGILTHPDGRSESVYGYNEGDPYQNALDRYEESSDFQ